MGILGLVENMSGFTCPHCGKDIDLFGAGGGERTTMHAGLKLLGRIPFDPNLVKCGDAGRAYQGECADSPMIRAFAEIVDAICRALVKQPTATISSPARFP